MTERKYGPPISNNFDLRVKNLQSSTLQNNMPLYEINNGSQEIIKIDLVFKCGRINESKVGTAKATISQIREGSSKMNSQELAYTFDYYGSSVKVSSGMEYSSISLVCLTRYFEKVWPIWFDMVTTPSFHSDELEKYINIYSQKLKDQISKNDVLSYRLITEKLFGSNHPYGYNTEPEDILSLRKEDLNNYFNRNCGLDNSFLILSGLYSDEIKNKICSDFESIEHSSKKHERDFTKPIKVTGVIKKNTQNDSQTSIKTGCLWVARDHKDRNKLKLLNTIIGGYFGSRLMKNIREDKGYTYGIYSSFDSWKKGGSFYIISDVSNDYIDPTLEEIKKEIEILKSKKIGFDELEMVKNYILGQSLNLIDGPFATSQLVKNLYGKDQKVSFFEKNIEEVKSITSDDIIEMANKYLNPEEFLTILVGKF